MMISAHTDGGRGWTASRKDRRRLGAVAVALLVAAGSAPIAIAQPPVALVKVDVQAVALGHRASDFRGRPVFNDRGEKIGTIDDLIIGRDRVLFTIVSVGGFLGLGDHKVAVPYESLHLQGDRITLPGATKQALTRLPEFRYLG